MGELTTYARVVDGSGCQCVLCSEARRRFYADPELQETMINGKERDTLIKDAVQQ